jgi:hypothetical protein
MTDTVVGREAVNLQLYILRGNTVEFWSSEKVLQGFQEG